MTIVCLGYRKGFAVAAEQRGLPIHFVVEKVKPALSSQQFTTVSDLADTEQVLRAVLHDVGHDVSAVVTGHEQALFSVAVLRTVFGTQGDADLEAALRFRDKYLQKSLLPSTVDRAGCEYLARDAPSFAAIAGRLGSRIVVKPADGYGSQRTELIGDQSALDSYVERNPTRSDVQTVVESFVDGFEIHVDGVWLNGSPLWMAVSTYLGPLMDWVSGGPIGDAPLGDGDPELSAKAERVTIDVLTALRAPDTVFHLEAFVRPDGGVSLGEVAARLAGALTAETILLTHGVDLFGAAVDLALGTTPEVPVDGQTQADMYGWVYLSRDPERPLREESFTQAFDIVDCDYPADSDGRIGSYGRWGHAIVSAPNHDALVDSLEAIAQFNRGT